MNICSQIQPDSLGSIFLYLTCLLSKTVLPFLITLAVVAFIWGVIQYFLGGDNEEKRKKGKSFILWGIISLFVMISIWGLVNILTKTFPLNPNMPTIPALLETEG